MDNLTSNPNDTVKSAPSQLLENDSTKTLLEQLDSPQDDDMLLEQVNYDTCTPKQETRNAIEKIQKEDNQDVEMNVNNKNLQKGSNNNLSDLHFVESNEKQNDTRIPGTHEMDENSDSDEDMLDQNLSESSSNIYDPEKSKLNQRFLKARKPRKTMYDELIKNINVADCATCLLSLQELSQITSMASEELFHQTLPVTTMIENMINVLSNPITDMDLFPEIVLLCCRCLYNVMDIFPNSISLFCISNGGVSSLVQLLAEIQYIDLAEQILKVLEKISMDFPMVIVKANGLFVSLQYLDFFTIHAQRTALSIVTYTTKSLPNAGPQSGNGSLVYEMISPIMAILFGVLQYHDKKLQESSASSLASIYKWLAKDKLKLKEWITQELVQNCFQILNADPKASPNFLHVSSILRVMTADISLWKELKPIDNLNSLLLKYHSEPFNLIPQSNSILDIISDMIPNLPNDGIFRIQNQNIQDQIELIEIELPDDMDSTFTVMCTVFMSSSNTAIRKKCIIVLLKCFHFIEATKLLKFIEDTPLINVVQELLEYHHSCIKEDKSYVHDERMLLWAGVSLLHILNEKNQKEFHRIMSKQGVIQEIQLLIKKQPQQSNSEMQIDIDTEKKIFSTFSKSRIMSGWTRERFSEADLLTNIFEKCQQLTSFCEKCSDCLSDLYKNQAARIASLQEEIKKETLCESNDKKFQEWIELIMKTDINEVIQDHVSEIVDFLVDFLLKSDELVWNTPLLTRIDIFKRNNQQLTSFLIPIISEYIARKEKFEIKSGFFASVPTLSDSRRSLSQLTRHIRIKVKPRNQGEFPKVDEFSIAIPVIAGFTTLSTFVKHRLQTAMIGADSEDEMDPNETGNIDESNTIDLDQVNPRKLYFFYKGAPISSKLNIFRFLYETVAEKEIWTTTHCFTYGYEENNMICSNTTYKPTYWNDCHRPLDVYQKLKFDPTLASEIQKPLTCLNLLHVLKPTSISDLLLYQKKLIQKISRQLQEPLMTISGIAPDWAWSLVYNYSIVLPFSCRWKFVSNCAFSYPRNVEHWIQSQKADLDFQVGILGKSKKFKVRIPRDHVFETMTKVLEKCIDITNSLEVEFINEVGTGLGPTVEFFTNVSKCITMKEGIQLKRGDQLIQIWRCQDAFDGLQNPKNGIYPCPVELDHPSLTQIKEIFFALGTFIAKSILDGRQLDIQFHFLFLQQLFQTNVQRDPSFSKSLLKSLDQELWLSLMKLEAMTSDELCLLDLDFSLPGYPEYKLLGKKSLLPVCSENVSLYIEKVIDATIGSGVFEQIQSFKDGFSKIIPIEFFSCFSPVELSSIISGEEVDKWTFESLHEAIQTDHGYQKDSKTIVYFYEMLCRFTTEQRREFLTFCTGSPRLPLGGLAALDPPLTVVCKTMSKDEKSDDCLPSVMTCAHYLKLPEYSSLEIMTQKFHLAMREGQNSFHLS